MRSPFLRKTRDRIDKLEADLDRLTTPSRLAPAIVDVSSNGKHEARIPSGWALPLVVAVSGVVGTPTGRVGLFGDGRHLTHKMLDGGVAPFTLRYPHPGEHRITARYEGDSVYANQPESSALALVVT